MSKHLFFVLDLSQYKILIWLFVVLCSESVEFNLHTNQAHARPDRSNDCGQAQWLPMLLISTRSSTSFHNCIDKILSIPLVPTSTGSRGRAQVLLACACTRAHSRLRARAFDCARAHSLTLPPRVRVRALISVWC